MKYYKKSNIDVKPRKKWKRYLVFGVSTLSAIYLIFMGFYYVTSEPSFCNSCHEMVPYVTSWSNSPHKQVKCMFCHEKRGVLGKLDSKARGLNDVYLQATGQYSVLFEAEVFQRNCASCHLGDYGNYPNTIRLDERHKQYIKKYGSCIECHEAPGHKLGLISDKRFR